MNPYLVVTVWAFTVALGTVLVSSDWVGLLGGALLYFSGLWAGLYLNEVI